MNYYSESENNNQPLGTKKAFNNRESERQFINVNMEDLFKSPMNASNLSESLYNICVQNGNEVTRRKVFNDNAMMMLEFLKENDVSAYNTVEYQATGNNNWTEILKAVNSEYMKFTYNRYVKWNVFVPTRNTLLVGERGNKIEKKMFEFRPEDIHSLDYWRTQEIKRYDGMFRDNNKIPIWQSSMNTRHYDRGNEGLATTADRASLESPVYAYDMSSIHEVLDGWTKEGWFGM